LQEVPVIFVVPVYLSVRPSVLPDVAPVYDILPSIFYTNYLFVLL